MDKIHDATAADKIHICNLTTKFPRPNPNVGEDTKHVSTATQMQLRVAI
jgi:hypothetical protein